MSLKPFFLSVLFLFVFQHVAIYGQSSDSIHVNQMVKLSDVQVVGYLQPQQRWKTPASVGIIHQKELETQSVESLVPVMNTVPGVRMEERSPGSYRLSIRGSLVRSPYGVRNVKIYYNDFALTDAGGNTYLNILNVNDLERVEILKGPDGSLFGANSGGVVFLNSNSGEENALRLKAYGGSYGLAGEAFQLSRNSGKHFWTLRQSYQRSDGYRRNAGNYRFFVQLSDKWQYTNRNHVEAYAFYSDLDYRTPGGLTEEQYNDDPKQSRPPTATMPGSAEQKTRISTRMYFAGIRHQAVFTPWLKHTLSVWGNHVDFVYPFITNYEIRKEKNIGLRTYFTITPNCNEGNKDLSRWKPSLDIGFETQRLSTDAYNYDNNAGVKGNIQAYNDILNHQSFGFIRGRVVWAEHLTAEAAVSLNYNGYHFRDTTRIKNNFPAVWMPHFAVSYQVSNPVILRFTLSKGYSTPTTAEVRPEDNKVHKDLFAEQGWNTEAGIRLNALNGRLRMDLSCFHYLLKDGIISQTNEAGNTYFVNSGRIKQLGIEYSGSYLLLPYHPNRDIFKKIEWNSSYTYAHYKYDKYNNREDDYSGNRVAGVPRSTLINSLRFELPASFALFIQHNYTSRIPLNDANSAFAKKYNLLSARLSMEPKGKSFIPSQMYLAFDNLLNQKYSLGNDLNAFGKRYYNAAPGFNFQLGATWKW